MTIRVAVESKRFPRRRGGRMQALGPLAFDAADGQFLCLVGPSGCGKSTLLQIVSGLDRDFEGAVRFEPPVGPDAPLGYVFQAPRLMPWLTVLENVRLVASQAALAEARPEALLAQMGLGDALETFPNRLSGGMQRRVALARAFVNRPRRLLLDEPFVSLDAPVAARLRETLLDLWRESGATVVFVTHDLREALFLADRILFLTPSPGRVALDWTNPAPRPRRPESPELESLRAELMGRMPDLLGALQPET